MSSLSKLTDPGIETASPSGRFFTTGPPGKPKNPVDTCKRFLDGTFLVVHWLRLHAANAGGTALITAQGNSRAWQPTPVFLPGESHGQKRLAGYSP